jgi:hypothetical protein
VPWFGHYNAAPKRWANVLKTISDKELQRVAVEAPGTARSTVVNPWEFNGSGKKVIDA